MENKSNFIKTLEISNFKSVKEAKFDCTRINIIIGKPNVGKSNILEAISLLGAADDMNLDNLFSEVRFKKQTELFYQRNTKNKIKISSDIYTTEIISNKAETRVVNYNYPIKRNFDSVVSLDRLDTSPTKFEHSHAIDWHYFLCSSLNNNGYQNTIHLLDKFDNSKGYTPFKRYVYNEQFSTYRQSSKNYLNPPYGRNFIDVFQENLSLRNEIIEIFREYDLEIVLDQEENSFEFQKKKEGLVIKFPIHLMAETLKHFMFYAAAIDSNDNSVLLFEEPEAHSFPIYTARLAEKIVESSNQYFVTTHDPYFLNEILSSDLSDVNVLLCDMEDSQTIIKAMTKEDLIEITNFGKDLFLTYESLLDSYNDK